MQATGSRSDRQGWPQRLAGGVAVVALAGALVMGPAALGGASSPSDATRADFSPGNVVTCAGVGFPGSKLASAQGAGSINQDGIVGTTSGAKQANIATPLPAGIVIQAVVVKGGAAYNVYRDGSGSVPADYTPVGPANPDGIASPQNYISPLNNGGNLPDISHWFICYTGGDTPPPPPPAPGTLVVKKVVSAPPPDGVAPTNTSATIECDDGTLAERTLPASGGDALEGPVAVATAGAHCWVTEGGFLDGVTYSVSPAEAQGPKTSSGTDGVNVPAATEVVVTVANSYAAVASQAVAAPPISTTPAFTG